MIRRREFLMGASALGALSAASFPFGPARAANPANMTVMTWGGLWGDSLAAGVDTPFTAQTGVPVIQDRSAPLERITKLSVNLDNQIFDLVQLHDGLFPLAQRRGVLEEINYDSPNLSHVGDLYPSFRHTHWIGQIFSAVGIAYNADEVKDPPKSWADLWRPEFRGRIVIPDVSHSIGTYIVAIGAIADGKDPKDGDAGLDRFRDLMALDPIIARDTDSIMSAFSTGEAVIGLLYKSQTFTVRDRGVNVEWVFPEEGAISISWGTGIAKNTPNLDLAEKYLNLTLEPEGQGHFTRAFNYPGSNAKMLGFLDPELRGRVEFSEEEIGRLINLDHEFMSDQRNDWMDRWNRIVAGG